MSKIITEQDLIKQRLRSLFYTDLYLFDKWCLNQTNEYGKNLMNETLHKRLCDFISYRKKNKLLILMPVGSFKTTCVTVGYSCQQICKNRDITILLDSETKSIAMDYLSEIKQNLEFNKRIKWLAGSFKGKTGWKEEQITVTKRKKRRKEPTVATSGIDNPATERHFDLIIIDDLVSNLNTNTPEQRKKVLDHFKVILTRVSGSESTIIVVGTRWSFLDVYSYIINELSDEFDTLILDAENDGKGNLLFPEKLSKKFLEDEKKRLGNMYYALYRNKPVASEMALFKKEWMRYYKEDELPQDVKFYTAVDPAVSTLDEADNYVVLTVGVSRMGKLYIDDVRYGHFTPDEGISHIIAVKMLYNPRACGIESNIFQSYVSHNLEKELEKRRLYLNIVELKHTGNKSKRERIEALQPYFKAGDIYIREGIKVVEDEAISYPKGRDDVLDALSMILEIIPRSKRDEKRGYYDRVPTNSLTGF